MELKEALALYLGLFEEVLEADESVMEQDNYDDYRRVLKAYNDLGGNKYDAVGTLRTIKEIADELPFE